MKPLIREGNRSKQVADIQARLRALGIPVDDEEGFFGRSTKNAVSTFQQRRGMLVDGVVGTDTWAELVGAGWRLGDRILYFKNPQIRGDDVHVLQGRLNALGFDAGRQDGRFGPETAQAVKAFQREYRIAEDGIFGPKTLAALEGLRIDRPGTAAGLREELRRTEARTLRGALVVVDPGHGGVDAGERRGSGLSEADICWDLATRLAERLVAAGARVRFTRTEPEGPDAAERAHRANEMQAEVFLSLHLNWNPEPTAEGTSTYYFDGSRAGEVLADTIQGELVRLGLKDCRTHGRAYPILTETRMPAVLVEPAFLSNADEAKRLEDPDFRAAITDAIATALKSYYEGR